MLQVGCLINGVCSRAWGGGPSGSCPPAQWEAGHCISSCCEPHLHHSQLSPEKLASPHQVDADTTALSWLWLRQCAHLEISLKALTART